MAVSPAPNDNFSRRTWRDAVAGALDGFARRISPQQAARSQPLPEHLTQSVAQAANAARYQQQAARQNNAGRRRPAASQQASAAQAPAMGVAQPDYAASELNAGALDTPMQMAQAPQQRPVDLYAPGAPLPITPTLPPPNGPRQYEYPIGYNITPQPRTTELTSFAQLRGLAFAYEGIRLCERVYFDVIASLKIKVSFKPNVIPDGESENDPKWQAIAAPAQAFLRRPDGVTDWQTWLTASVRDELELGHSFLYLRRDRLGRLRALDLLDAATIKPLIDERGRMPQPPYPAFEQYLYGVPAYYLASNEVVWIREMGRTESVYSTSRVEDIIIRVNQALQKEALDLARYTDGAVPQGIMTVPEDVAMTAEQLETLEQLWNGLLAGNHQMRVRVKFAPKGATFQSTQPDNPLIDFDRFLLNLTVASFGLTMDELGMTETSNRSVGESQQAVIYRRTVRPLTTRRAHLLTELVQAEFDPRLIVEFTGYEEEEEQLTKAQTLDIGVKNGSLSPSRMAKMMGWPVDLEVPPMIVTKDGPLWLEDALNLRQAQLDAKLAGLQFAIAAPGSAQAPGAPGASGASGASGAPATSGSPPTDDDEPPPSNKPAPPAKKAAPAQPVQTAKTAKPQRADASCCHVDGEACSDDCDCPPECVCRQSGVEPEPETERSVGPATVSDEYRRWRTVALRAVKAGKSLPHFTSSVIPLEDYALLARDLSRCVSADDVRGAFQRAKAREQAVPRAHAGGGMGPIPLSPSPASVPATLARTTTRPPTPRGKVAPDVAARHRTPTGVQLAEHALAARALAIFDEVAREGYHAAQE
jgi:hypothetical protein